MRQTEKIVQYMKMCGSITPVEAMRDLGVMRLAARISDIEASGVEIDRQMETSKNRFGEKTHYMRYSIRKDES